MRIVPAVDIRGGLCVNLVQGNYAQETIFAEDPVAQARLWWRALKKSLPEAEFRSGLAEVVKCGFIADPAILELAPVAATRGKRDSLRGWRRYPHPGRHCHGH